jgi:hypothetical protein
MSDKKRITALMIKYLSIMLAAMAAVSLFVFPAYASSEPLRNLFPTYDLSKFAEIIKTHRETPLNFKKYTESEKCAEAMENLTKQNGIIVPSFVDIADLGEDEIEISLAAAGENGADVHLNGTAGGYRFSLFQYFGKNKSQVPRPLNAEYYKRSFDMVRNVIGGIEVTAYAPGRFPVYDDILNGNRKCYFEFAYERDYFILSVDGIEHFEKLFENFGIKIYPFTNGYVRIGNKTYYNKDGEFLKGWYKIGGKRRHFDKNGLMATGVVPVGEKYYFFDYQGVYIEPFTGTIEIDGKKRVYEDGVYVG